MTGYTVHTGTSKKFTNGWDRIFDQAEDKKKTDTKQTKKKKKKTKKDS